MAPIILKLFRNNLPRPTQKHLSRSFANLMFEGKTKAAICLLTEEAKGGLLHLSDHVDTNLTVKDVLIDKHPSGQPAHPKSLIEDDPPEVQPVLFDAFMIRSATLRTTGAAGPSWPDDASWRRLCTSFKSASINLCHSLAITTQHLCMKFVDPCISYCPIPGLPSDCLEQESGCTSNWDWGHCKTDHCQIKPS